MYHIISEDTNKINDYVITPTQLEQDLIYIKENGYQTITTKQLLNFINNNDNLPEKPILITFDDGYESVYKYALPLLQKYNMTAVSSVLGKQADYYSENYNENQINYSHSTWEQLNEMVKSNIFELGNHTYDMHLPDNSIRFGTLKNYGESDYEYKLALETDIGKLNSAFEKNLGFIPNIFAYPYGKISDSSKPIIENMGFEIILTCEEKINTIYQNQTTPLYLMRFNRSGHDNSYDFFDKFI